MKKFFQLSDRTQSLARHMRKQEQCFIKNSEVRSNAKGIQELMDEAFAHHHLLYDIEGVKLTHTAVRFIDGLAEGKENYVFIEE